MTRRSSFLRRVLVIVAAGSLLSGYRPAPSAGAQPQAAQFDVLIANGHVIDPRNGLDAVMDVAVTGAKIARVGAKIDPALARRVVDATGLYVVPGLIDIHAHVFFGTEKDAYLSNADAAVPPDNHSFRSGQTTLVDAGGAGWRNFLQFKEQVIDRAKTRVLSFINIVGSGMKGGPVEQNLADMDASLTAMRIKEYPGLIVGVKVAHYLGSEWDPVTRAVAAGRETNVPVMVDFGRHTPPLSLSDLLLVHLRPGDILTHTYAHVDGRTPIVGEDGKVRPYVWEARKRGVIFDAGHGGGSFLFRQAVPAIEAGLCSGRHQHRSPHRQHELGNEGHPQHDVEVPQSRDAAGRRDQGQHGSSRRRHQAAGPRESERRR